MNLHSALALHRFGLGARPGEGERLGDPAAWATAQLEGSPAAPAAKGAAAILADLPEPRAMKAQGAALVKQFRAQFIEDMAARFRHGFATEAPFRERLVWFWANHFSVAVTNVRVLPFCASYEAEAIRPHVTGRFADMLIAVARHPAMLIYLDQAQSIGPNSRAGRRAERGLNENLAREILELHTLSVGGGYGQGDVVALAKILTGWSVPRRGEGRGDAAFQYFPNRHEPGEKTLLGQRFGEGEEEGVRALTMLARHPATARHVAVKLAQHFIADEPPPASVERLAAVFTDTDGDLAALARALVADPAAWTPTLVKVRPPVDYVTACVRALAGEAAAGMDADATKKLMQATRLMGQFPFGAPSPKGWPDNASAWAGADAILERIEWAHALASRVPRAPNAPELAERVLGPLASAETTTILARAPTPVDGLGLFLASPEMVRR